MWVTYSVPSFLGKEDEGVQAHSSSSQAIKSSLPLQMPEERQFQAEQDVQAEANYAKIIQIEVVQTEADLEDI